MPAYKVIDRGFLGGCLYTPDSNRNVVRREEAFPEGETPKWLQLIDEPVAKTRAEKAAETKARNAALKKAASDAEDIKGASFLDEPKVETL